MFCVESDNEESGTISDVSWECSDSDSNASNGAPQRDLTDFGCYVNIIRGNLGPGCLSLPHAFACAGIWLSLGLSLPILVLCIFSFNILLWAKEEVVSQGLMPCNARLSYSDIA